jgi:hypothetical protein
MADQQLLIDPQTQEEDVAAIEHESHFGCVRLLVWAMVFEVALVIAGLLWWRLRLWPL